MRLCEESGAVVPQSLVNLVARNSNLSLLGHADPSQKESPELLRRVALLLESQREWQKASALLALAGLRVEALECLAAGGDPAAVVAFASESLLMAAQRTRDELWVRSML